MTLTIVITVYGVKFLILGGNYGSTAVVYKVVLEGQCDWLSVPVQVIDSSPI